MEKSEQSEEKIIQLGKSLIDELGLTHTHNILSRWMAHYLAELLLRIEGITQDNEVFALKKEAADLILKLWSAREDLPIAHPQKNLQQIIETLEAIQDTEASYLNAFYRYPTVPKDNQWASFVKVVKEKTSEIFKITVQNALGSKAVQDAENWYSDKADFLNPEDQHLLKILKSLSSGQPVENPPENNDQVDPKNIQHSIKRIGVLINEQRDAYEHLKQQFRNDDAATDNEE